MAESTIARLKRLQKSFNRGEMLFQQGAQTHEMFVLLNGEVTVYKNEQKIAVLNTPNTFIGEIGALLKLPRSATCIATRSSTMLCIPGDNIESFFKMAPTIGFKLAMVLAERLNEMNDRYMKAVEDHDDF